MTFAAHRLDGPAVQAGPASRARKLTPEQARNRRNALWLFAVEIGLHDPSTGRVRPHSVSELAGLFGCTAQAVRNGLDSARTNRALAEGIARGE